MSIFGDNSRAESEQAEWERSERNQGLRDGIAAWNTALQTGMLDKFPVGSWLAVGLGEGGEPCITVGSFEELCIDARNAGRIVYQLTEQHLATREFKLAEMELFENYD